VPSCYASIVRAGPVIAGALQRVDMIRYSRGHIIILDRRALGATACNVTTKEQPGS
jgi:hypothetical protein